MDQSGEDHSGHHEWVNSQHYSETHHGMENVVQIIVPELPCLGQAPSDNSLSNALHHVPSDIGLIGTTVNGTIIGGTLRGASLNGSKGSLSALAAAIELDQVRSDVLQPVENIMDETKFIKITTNDNKASELIAHVVDKPNGAILHRSTYNFEHKLHQDLRQLPMAPFLDANDDDANFYNEIYHYLCSAAFPEGVSEVYKKVIKRRATNYLINENGTLSYGHKSPKLVLTCRQEQKQILEATHIDKDSGVHYGVRKMYGLIFAKYYWKSLYVDVGQAVKSCHVCTETVFMAADDPVEIAHDWMPLQNTITSPKDRILRVWKSVLVKIHGPYKKTIYGNQYVISIVDPFSSWILARPSHEGNLESNCANFIFETFCTFGFAQCQVVGLSCESFEMMQGRYREKFDASQDVLRSLVPFDSEDAQHGFMFTLQEKSTECNWTDEMLDDLCSTNPDTWDDEISKLLFRFNTSKSSTGRPCPFSIMFARGPTGYISDEEKENINILEEEKALEVPTNRRKLRSSTLQCRHCHETFTSKISFRIHQRKHTEEAQRRGTMEGEKRIPSVPFERKSLLRNKRRRRIFHRGERLVPVPAMSWQESNREPMPNCLRQQLTQSTVDAVRNLLNATKEERSKRGKYFKYTPELRDEIAQYALDHCIPAATAYWSARLGNTVSESSIRNFIKTYKFFSNETKEEIGKYAFSNGIERAVQHFNEKFGFGIRKGLVIKFKKYYIKKYYDGNQNGEYSCEANDSKFNVVSRQKRSFSLQIKDDIGRFAVNHGIPATINHFSVKLQFPVKQSTVRKFKRLFLEKNASTINNQSRNNSGNEGIIQENIIMSDQQNGGNEGMDVLHPMSVLNTANIPCATGINLSTNNNFVYQHSYPLNMTPGSTTGNTTVSPMNLNSLAFHQGSVINQGVASLSYQQSPSTVIMNQPFTQVARTAFQPTYVNAFPQPGAAGNNGQGVPITISNSAVSSSSMIHNTSPLQLTMGGPHLSQINPVSIAPAHQLGLHNSQIIHTATHHPHQLLSSNYQNLSGSLSFETPINHQTTVNLSNEPLSLMKEPSQVVETMQQQHSQGTVQASNINDHSVNTSTSINGIQTSIIHISNSHVLDPTTHQISSSQLQLHPHNQNSQSQHQDEPILHEVEESEATLKDEIMESDFDDDYQEVPTPRKKRCKAKTPRNYSSVYSCGKRGNYVSYSPELRAEIGRYAAEQGNLAAVTHFKEKMGIDIPESTVRGLKEKYMLKRAREDMDVKSLGFEQRGRPMRLGKYDAIVQECMKELLKSGEKVSSFLVIATAKQVLMQYEPSLLEENGGPVKLNPTWAKSFLKRIGLSHLS